LKHPSVLIVEDEGLIALSLVQLLEKSGYEVPDPVISGEDAIQSVKMSQPDVILMDIRLAGKMSGIDAARRIRKTVDIPVVFLTAHSEKEQLAAIQKIDLSSFIVKPFSEDEVLAAIGKALGPGR
jgi:CheY-like chemotaxis protein